MSEEVFCACACACACSCTWVGVLWFFGWGVGLGVLGKLIWTCIEMKETKKGRRRQEINNEITRNQVNEPMHNQKNDGCST